jgi:hypothetical protein
LIPLFDTPGTLARTNALLADVETSFEDMRRMLDALEQRLRVLEAPRSATPL